MVGFFKMIKSLNFLFNCINHNEDYFDDATEMAQALENSEEVTIKQLEERYNISVGEINAKFNINVDIVEILDNGLISLYDENKDVHYFFNAS